MADGIAVKEPGDLTFALSITMWMMLSSLMTKLPPVPS